MNIIKDTQETIIKNKEFWCTDKYKTVKLNKSVDEISKQNNKKKVTKNN